MMRLALLGAAAGLAAGLLSSAQAAPTTITGDYVEARSASVFAGGCHFGSEYTTEGKQATLVWHVRSGSSHNVPLDGLTAIAVISGDKNLAAPGAQRKSVIYLEQRAKDNQMKALGGLLQSRYRATLGQVVALKRAPIRFAKTKTGYRVEAPGIAALVVDALPNNDCCTMPSEVWYKPFASVTDRRVGYTVKHAYQDSQLKGTWSRGNENSAFYGTFAL